MKILAIDSTGGAAAAALMDDERLLAKDFLPGSATQSRTLLPMIEKLLVECRLGIDDIDLFAATAGPGSFTGVRIGAATLKGLAFGRGKPAVPVSALEALAYNMRDTDCTVCAAMDARRGQFYTARFSVKGGMVTRLTPDRAISGEELAKELCGAGDTVLVGDGAEAALPFFDGLSVSLAPQDKRYIDGESVGLCALLAAREKKTVGDAEFSPVYLRLPQAERERLEREK